MVTIAFDTSKTVQKYNNFKLDFQVTQSEGEFIVTFPHAYHGGINLDNNWAEANNFGDYNYWPAHGFGAEYGTCVNEDGTPADCSAAKWDDCMKIAGEFHSLTGFQ